MANEKIHEYLNQRTNLNLLGSEFFDVDATDDLGVSWFSAKVLLSDLLTWLNENGLNIYYSDGTLQGDRTITANTYFTRWMGGDVMIVHVDPTNEYGFIINDADNFERARLGLNQESNSGKLELRNGTGEFLNAVNNIVRIGYGSNGIAKFTEVKEATSNILFTAVGLTGGDEVLKILHEITNGDVNIAEKIEITGTNSENIGIQITATGATENNAVKAISGNIAASSGQIYSSIPTTHVPTGTTQTINWDGGNGQVIDLGSATGDVTLTLNNPKAGARYFIKIIQGSTPRNIIFPVNIIWTDNVTPEITTLNDAVDFVEMKYDGVNYYAEIIQNYGNSSPIAHLDDIKNFNFIEHTETSHTGNTTETVLHTIEIPPNTIGVGDCLNSYIQAIAVGLNDVKTWRVYISPNPSLTGAELIYNFFTNNLRYMVSRKMWVGAGSVVKQFRLPTENNSNGLNGSDNSGTTDTAAIDFTTTKYLVVSVQLGNAADVATLRMSNLLVSKPNN